MCFASRDVRPSLRPEFKSVITLMTPHGESMYDPSGLEKSFAELREKIGQVAQKIAETSDYRVLLITRSGPEESIEAIRHADRNPLVVRVPHMPINPRAEPIVPVMREVEAMAQAMRTIHNVAGAIEAVCGRAGQRNHIVFIDDADFYFYQSHEPGAFTRRLDSDPELMELICALGETVAGYDGYLVLAAPLSQYSRRLREFLDRYAWSWVRYRAQELELQFGRIPDILRPYCRPKQELGPPVEWSRMMTIQELANRFEVHRNTMRKRLRKQEIQNEQIGGLYRVPDRLLPPTKEPP